jgi:hypothetical protein
MSDLLDREASHLCHNNLCLSSTHLTFGHHTVNIDRNSCGGPAVYKLLRSSIVVFKALNNTLEI